MYTLSMYMYIFTFYILRQGSEYYHFNSIIYNANMFQIQRFMQSVWDTKTKVWCSWSSYSSSPSKMSPLCWDKIIQWIILTIKCLSTNRKFKIALKEFPMTHTFYSVDVFTILIHNFDTKLTIRWQAAVSRLV
jgi:hypothetical protein